MSNPVLQIVSKKWSSGRGSFTSVERFCFLLNPEFEQYHGKRLQIPYRIGQWLKQGSNSRRVAQLPVPYNSYSAQIEFQGIVDAARLKSKYIFFPYADFDYYYMRWARKLLGSKVILWSYFSEWELKHRFTNLNHFKSADLVLVAGKGQYRYMKSQLPFSRVHFFPLGVDTDFFQPAATFDRFTVVHSGANRRDFETLILAFDRLVEVYPQSKLELIGAFSVKEKIPARPYLKIHESLSDTEMLEVYQKANFLVLSVTDGGSSNSLNEGMACGLPVIVTDVTNIADYITDDFAFRFPVKDDLQMCELMIQLIENTVLRQSYSAASRRHALNFDWMKLRDEFLSLLKELDHV